MKTRGPILEMLDVKYDIFYIALDHSFNWHGPEIQKYHNSILTP